MTETTQDGPKPGRVQTKGGGKPTEIICDGDDAYQAFVQDDGTWRLERWLRDDKTRQETLEVLGIGQASTIPESVLTAIEALGGTVPGTEGDVVAN